MNEKSLWGTRRPKPVTFGEVKNLPVVTIDPHNAILIWENAATALGRQIAEAFSVNLDRVYGIRAQVERMRGETRSLLPDAYVRHGDELRAASFKVMEAERQERKQSAEAESDAIGRALGVMRRKMGGV